MACGDSFRALHVDRYILTVTCYLCRLLVAVVVTLFHFVCFLLPPIPLLPFSSLPPISHPLTAPSAHHATHARAQTHKRKRMQTHAHGINHNGQCTQCYAYAHFTFQRAVCPGDHPIWGSGSGCRRKSGPASASPASNLSRLGTRGAPLGHRTNTISLPDVHKSMLWACFG